MVEMIKYGSIISDKALGDKILIDIRKELEDQGQVKIDFSEIKSMATFCAKQIFGALYLNLGPESFFEKVIILNANEDIRIIIRVGIENAVDTKS